VLAVKVRVLVAAVIALASLTFSPALAHGSSGPPTSGQIQRAVRQAERSTDLWTTINICNGRRHPLTIGIRGQMPALGFRTSLLMDVQALYWSDSRFIPVPRVRRLVDLGSHATGLHQGGVSFRFAPGAGRLSGAITFIWKRNGKVLAQATRQASKGHPDADYGSPARYSASQCKIP